MNKHISIDERTRNEIAALLALGILRQKQRKKAENKAFMMRKALDFRAEGSIHVSQEHDHE